MTNQCFIVESVQIRQSLTRPTPVVIHTSDPSLAKLKPARDCVRQRLVARMQAPVFHACVIITRCDRVSMQQPRGEHLSTRTSSCIAAEISRKCQLSGVGLVAMPRGMWRAGFNGSEIQEIV